MRSKQRLRILSSHLSQPVDFMSMNRCSSDARSGTAGLTGSSTQHRAAFTPTHARLLARAGSSAATVAGERQLLTQKQLAFMNTFGYLVLPGLVADKFADIVAGFSAVWDVDSTTGLPRRPAVNTGRVHDDSTRSYIVPFIDQHPK